MPIGDFQDFQERYYKTISQIAVKAVNIGSLSFDDHDNSLDFFIGDEFDDELGDLKSLRVMAVEANVDIEGFKFGLGNSLLEKAENMKIFQYFHDIDNGEKVEIDISTLDIPDISKQEIQAQGFVNAFDNMKENGRDPVDSVKFQKYYQNVQSLSMQSDLLEVENPELSASLDRANGIFDSFNKVYAITPDKSNVGDMLNKAEKAYELQQELKLELAQHIALNGIAVFDENGEISKQYDNLEVGNIFEGKSLDDGISPYLNKNFRDLITQQDEIVKLNKVFKALGIDGQNIDSFKKLVDEARVEINKQKIAESKKSVETDIQQTVKSQQSTTEQVSTESGAKSISEKRSNDLKEQLARKILEVARVSPEKITDIMVNPKMANAKEAIMKRAVNTLESLGVNEKDLDTIGPTNALSKVKNEDLQNQIKNQSKELIAQVGRVSSWSIDYQDMRGKENLHEKYQDKASKLDKTAFNKNVEEALNYEKSKDDRGVLGTIGRTAINSFKKPLQRLDAMRPVDDKPFFTPAKTALAGLVALAVLAPPLGAIVAIPLLCKAAKNQLYDDTIIEDIAQITGRKMMEWAGKLKGIVTGKPYEKPIEKVKEGMINEGALDKVSVISLIPEKTQNLEQTVAKDQVPEKTQNLEQSVVRDKSVDVSTVKGTESVKPLDKPKDKLQEMIDSNPELRRDFEKVVSTAVQSSQQREEVLKVTKEIAGKDASGKQRPMDDLDLMSAKSRVSNEARKHKGSDIGR